MSSNQPQDFCNVFTQDELRKSLHDVTDEDDAIARMVELGRAKGYRFSADEVRAELQRVAAAYASGELSDDVLDAVAAGEKCAVAGSAGVTLSLPQQLKLQEQMERMQKFSETLSNSMKSIGSTDKTITGNMK